MYENSCTGRMTLFYVPQTEKLGPSIIEHDTYIKRSFKYHMKYANTYKQWIELETFFKNISITYMTALPTIFQQK